MGIIDIYSKIVLNAKYDEAYAGNLKQINGKNHGVCIDFSKQLLSELRKNNYECGLISTLNDDGFNHAAVVYRDKDTNEVFIADPVTDVRLLEENKTLFNIGSKKIILKNNNYRINPRDYIRKYGVITAYDDSINIIMENIQNKEEVEAIPSINREIKKKLEACQTANGLDAIKNLADGPTLLACQSLYKKGIATYCSNYNLGEECSINVRFNSLSDENKKILFDLKNRFPDNYSIMESTGFYGRLGHNNEYNEEKPFELVFGFTNTNGKDDATINIEMNNLISMLKKQVYQYGVYSREDVLSNKHHKMRTDRSILGLKECNSNSNNTNEEIAKNEGLIYSSKYDLFFDNYICKSRYIESLYRTEHDLRTSEEIAQDANIYFDSNTGLFYESYQDMLNYTSASFGLN